MLKLLLRFLFASFVLAPGAVFANAGYVHDLTGTATVTPRGGSAQPLRTGDIVAAGSTVSTGNGSTAVVKFEDGQIAALNEKTAFRIDEFNFNKQKVSESRASFNLLQGGLRFITGVIGATNRNAVQLRVGTATIGIRGTDVVVVNDPVTQAVLAQVLAGFVQLTNPAGTQSVAAGNASVFTGNNPPSQQAPASSAPLPPAALAVAQAAVATLTAATANIPVNTPVVLQASANAARLLAAARANPADTALAAQAQAALQNAIAEGQKAFDAARAAGAANPAPPAPPGLAPKPGATAPTPAAAAAAATDAAQTLGAPATSLTTSTPTGSAGAGGGGGTTTTCPTGTIAILNADGTTTCAASGSVTSGSPN